MTGPFVLARRVAHALVAVALAAALPGRITAQSDGGAPPAPETAARPLSVEEVVDFVSFPGRTPIQLSPDGERVAYTVEYAQRTTGSTSALIGDSAAALTEVRITDTRTGETVRVIDARASSWGPAWSPDGSRLAFYSNRTGPPRLWVWDRGAGGAREISDAIVWSEWTRNRPRWTPDGGSLVVKIVPEGRSFAEMRRLASDTPVEPDSNPADGTVRVFRSKPNGGGSAADVPEWLRWRYGGDLAVIDLESGAVRRLASAQVPVWWDVSRDGSWLAFVRFADPRHLAEGFRLGVVNLSDGAVRDLPGVIRQTWGEAVSWSPRGNRLAYITPGEGDEGGLFIADPERGARRRLGDARSGWAESFRGPLWSADGGELYFTGGNALWSVDAESGDATAVARLPGRDVLTALARREDHTIWSPDGRSALVRVRDPKTREMGFIRIDLSSGAVVERMQEEGVFSGSVNTDVARDGSVAVVLYSDTRHAPDLWSLGADLQRIRRLTQFNPPFQPDRLGESRRVEWTTEAGEELAGTLLLPPAYEAGIRVPLIVEVYGGNRGSREIHRFDRHRQLLASRGYAVLVPDAPLSTGTPLRDHARTILPGVDRVVELGIADPERLGVTGHSYGGYGTLALLVQTDRFGAAVASAGHGNMVGMFADLDPDGTGSTVWAERGQGRMGGTPWEVRERYIENSPFFFLDRVETPLLLLHGAEDRNTPVYLAGQLFAGLRRLGRNVVLARYEGESHWPGSWSAANQIDYWRRLVDWFDEQLSSASGR